MDEERHKKRASFLATTKQDKHIAEQLINILEKRE